MKFGGGGWTLLLLGNILIAQPSTLNYPNWFLQPKVGGHVIGLSQKFSDIKVSKENAVLDAIAMYEMYRSGSVKAEVIKKNKKIANAPGDFYLDTEVPTIDDMVILDEAAVGNLYLILFAIQGDREFTKDPLGKWAKITITSKYNIKNDRVYEAWMNAETKALDKLCYMKESKVRSLFKRFTSSINGSNNKTSKIERIIHITCETKFNNVNIEKRWVKDDVVYVMASDWVKTD